MLSVLFVEDDKEAIITILDRIDQDESGIEQCVCDFHEAEEKIRSLRPDIVVLDLFEGPLNEENNRGSEHFNFIWENQFCPVIVHTGLPDALEGYENPFVQVLKKGGSSEEEVLKAICRFEPHVQALKDTEDYIRDSLSFAMRDIAPFAFDTFSQVEQTKRCNSARWEATSRCNDGRVPREQPTPRKLGAIPLPAHSQTTFC